MPGVRAVPPGRFRSESQMEQEIDQPDGQARQRAPQKNPPVDRRAAGRGSESSRNSPARRGRSLSAGRSLFIERPSAPGPRRVLSLPPKIIRGARVLGKSRQENGGRAKVQRPGAVGWCKRTNPMRFNSRSPVPKPGRFAQPIGQRAPPGFPSWSLRTRRSLVHVRPPAVAP